MKPKKANRYDIRYYSSESIYSKRVGCKGKLFEFRQAVKIVKRLKRS